jgi:hypothetical protein
MHHHLRFLRVLLFPLLAVPSIAVAADEPIYDLVIYGGTSGGVAAGVQARRMGKTAIVIEPTKDLGGLTTGGLGATDIGNKGAIGGISREFYQRIRQHYADPAAWKYEKPEQYRSGRGSEQAKEDAMWTFEPHVAEALMDKLCEEAGVVVVRGERLHLAKGVEKQDGRIVSIRMESGKVFRGKMFIDATYEGDLLAKAGVSYTVGREANSQYGETLSGVQVKNATKHQFVKPVDPYVKPGDPASGLLPRVEAGPPAKDGEGDKRVQAYNYRLCATDRPENRRPWPKPASYEERQYEILLRNFEAGDMRVPWNPILMPNRKTDANNNFAFSTDNIGMNYGYPEGDYATRERIIREHIDYQQGLMWTLANHPRVPESIRKQFQTWGLAKDEFQDTDNWPQQLYVREARRMVGHYVMTQHNCQGREVAKDSVGLAAYTMDSHNVQRYVDAAGHVRNEGDVQVGGFAPYAISYGSLIPKEAECQNLLVPVCLSATHISYGSIRMEPVFMVLGQSCATAAALAIDSGTSVQAVDYTKLRERLLADKQVLEWTGPRPTTGIDASKLPGLVIDDEEAAKRGDWSKSSSIGGYVGGQYLHDNNEQKGELSATYKFTLKEPGTYEVRIAYTANPNRATNVPVTIRHAGGETRATIDQKKQPAIDKLFHSLGKHRFEKEAVIEITNADTNGYVVIDAVQLVRGE